MALRVRAGIPAASDAMMLAGVEMRWRMTASLIILVRCALHVSAALVALAGLAAGRSTLLDPLYRTAYGIAFALALAGAVTPPLSRWRCRADALAAAWLALAVLSLADFIFIEAGITLLVRAAEALAIGAAIFSTDRDQFAGNQSRHLLLVATSLMLALFGWIHVIQVDAIASLVPAWFPGRDQVPFFTGGIMLAAGAGLWLPKIRTIAALLVAGMFLCWLPLVHAGRLWANPTDASEWSFAAMAIALSACMIILLTRFPGNGREQREAKAGV